MSALQLERTRGLKDELSREIGCHLIIPSELNNVTIEIRHDRWLRRENLNISKRNIESLVRYKLNQILTHPVHIA